MYKQEESIDEFEQLADQLLMYSFSSQLVNKHTPRNKTQSNHKKSQQSNLKLQPSSHPQDKSTFMNKYTINSHHQDKKKIFRIGDSVFMSNFQCGSLHMVDYIAQNTYRITLQNQINSDRMSIWFYFRCCGLKGENYFIIDGFTKSSSLYNEGMKICYRDSASGQVWRRGGSKISYVQSMYENGEYKKTYQLRFSYFFQNSGNNYVEFAYCFPYSFSKLINFIYPLHHVIAVETLAKSYEGRQIPVLTIGNVNSEYVIFLSARVHPGQTVSSFIMEGFIKQLVSQNYIPELLRKNIMFKILPMINPDGVYRGNYRFSSAGCDLNRKWKSCSSQKHPQVYYWKEYMKKINSTKKTLMYIDIHGHSRQKNAFFYGCCPFVNGIPDQTAKQFPYLMEEIYGSAFKYDYCCFAMQKDKEGTARITMWRQLKNVHVYTLQSTFCGPNNGGNYLQADYQKIGHKLCQGISAYFSDIFQSNTNNTNTQPKQLEIVEKLKQIKHKKIEEWKNNPSLKNIGMEDEVGSQSEPDVGENNGKYDQLQLLSKNSNRITIKTPNIKKTHNSISYKVNQRVKIQDVKTKLHQKSFLADNDLPKTPHKEIISFKSHTTDQLYNEIPKKSTIRPSTNHKMAFQVQKINIHETQQNQKTIHFQFNNSQSWKRKLMLERGGVQYRRVKKLAEQFSRNNNFINPQEASNAPIVRGLIGGNNNLLLQPQKKSKTIAPQFYSSQGSRKASIEIRLKKGERQQERQLESLSKRSNIKQQIQVKCRGSRIYLNQ